MTGDRQQYLSYLLRLWQEPDALPGTWRASLENSRTGELSGFAGMAQLFAFLERQLGATTGTTTTDDPRTRKRIAETGGKNDSDHYTCSPTEDGAGPTE